MERVIMGPDDDEHNNKSKKKSNGNNNNLFFMALQPFVGPWPTFSVSRS
jgi:hypothetical protein